MPAGPFSRPWRRFLRFSMRALIVLVLVIGAGLGSIVRSARIQREAVAAIENTQSIVVYDWEWSDGKGIPGGKPWAPRWLVDLLGVDYFGHVTGVWLVSSSAATDATLAQVERLPRLQGLNIFTSFNDAGLVHLKGLTDLTQLNLGGTAVSDSGLAHLKGLTNLSILGLSSNPITDAGLTHLERLTNLRILLVDGTRITDAGLVHLKGLCNLSELYLGGTHVTDAGLAHLKGLSKITRLDLHNTQVTDAGAAELEARLPSLRVSTPVLPWPERITGKKQGSPGAHQ